LKEIDWEGKTMNGRILMTVTCVAAFALAIVSGGVVHAAGSNTRGPLGVVAPEWGAASSTLYEGGATGYSSSRAPLGVMTPEWGYETGGMYQEWDIVDTAASTGGFSTFSMAIKAAGLEETLREGGPYTVFAPTDEAFARLSLDRYNALFDPANRDELVDLVEGSIVLGSLYPYDLRHRGFIVALNGKWIPLGYYQARGPVTIDGAMIIGGGIDTDNGVIYALENVPW
jgi:hypothetical protein